jgi:integrase/recombinase XerC
MQKDLISSINAPLIEKNSIIDIDSVIDEFVATKRSVNTRRAYSRDIADLFVHIKVTTLNDLGSIPFFELVTQIQGFLENATDYDEETKRPLNPKTVNRKTYSLSSFFKYLMHAYNYPKNPLDQHQAHKFDKRSTTTSLTRSEVIDVLNYMAKGRKKSQTTFRDYLIFCCLSVLALRRNELVGLKWTDIDEGASSINVFQKGGSYKLLPLPKSLLDQLNWYRNGYDHISEYIFSPVRNNATKRLNKPLNTSYVYKLVKRVVAKVVNGKKATPHSFRKSFIEMALNNQEDFISIINATGHSTVEMVKYYDTRDTLKNNAVHSMGKLI